MSDRASMFDDDDFNPTDLPEKARSARPDPEMLKKVAEATSFDRADERRAQKGRAGSKKKRRVHRTGRSIQLNVKVDQETYDLFYKLSDKHDWVLGETLKHALHALNERD